METKTRLTTGSLATFTASFENSGVRVNHIAGAGLTISRYFYAGAQCLVLEVRENEFQWAEECSFPYRVGFADGTEFLVLASEVA